MKNSLFSFYKFYYFYFISFQFNMSMVSIGNDGSMKVDTKMLMKTLGNKTSLITINISVKISF